MSEARDINDSGSIVGISETGIGDVAVHHAFYLREGASMVDLGTLIAGIGQSAAHGINNHEQVVGSSDFLRHEGLTIHHAFVWQSGRLRDLRSLAYETNSSVAHAINDDGLVVGYGLADGPIGVLWDLAIESETYPSYPSQRRVTPHESVRIWSLLQDVNSRGLAVGNTRYGPSSEGNHAVSFRAPHSLDWFTCPSREEDPPHNPRCEARGVDDWGRAAGLATVDSGDETLGELGRWFERAVLWRSHDSRIWLGTLGGARSRANDLNNDGLVVGGSEIPDGQWRAFVYHDRFGMRALPTLPGGADCEANAINASGQIVGHCVNEDGHKRAVQWVMRYERTRVRWRLIGPG